MCLLGAKRIMLYVCFYTLPPLVLLASTNLPSMQDHAGLYYEIAAFSEFFVKLCYDFYSRSVSLHLLVASLIPNTARFFLHYAFL